MDPTRFIEADLFDELATTFSCFVASGPSCLDCAVIAQRFDAAQGFRWDASESWLLRARPSGHPAAPADWSMVAGGTEWLTRVWLSPAGVAWACGAAGTVLQALPDGTVTRHVLPAALSGVWGLSDASVWAWSEAAMRLFAWDGAAWSEVECPGRVVVMHGLDPRALWAGGYGGWIWRWDGARWSTVDLALEGTVVGLHIADALGGYACTTRGEVAELSPWGAQYVDRWRGPLLDATCTDDAVLLAAGAHGIVRLPRGEATFEEVETDFLVERFDQRAGAVLISAFEGLVETRDGRSFGPEQSMRWFRDQRAMMRPLYR